MKMKNTLLKMIRYSCLLFVIVFGLTAIIGSGGGGEGGGSDELDQPEPEISISDYVSLDIIWGEASISFPNESGNSTAQYSNIEYWFDYVISYDLLVTFADSGNVYDMHVDLTRLPNTNVNSITASINATINGEQISGTLTYP